MQMMRSLRMVLMLTPLALLATADQAWGQFRTTGGSGIGRGNTGGSQLGGSQLGGTQLGGNRGSTGFGGAGGGGGAVFGTQTSIGASVFGTQQAGNVSTTGTAGVDFMSEFRSNPLGGSGVGNSGRGTGFNTGSGFGVGAGNTGFGTTGFNSGFGNTGFNSGFGNTGFGNTGLNRGLNSTLGGVNTLNRGGLGAGQGGFNTLGGRGNQLGAGGQGFGQGTGLPGRNQRGTSIAPAYVMRASADIPRVVARPEVVTRLQGVIAKSPSIPSAAKVQMEMNSNVLVLRGVVSSDHERAVIETMARLEPGVHNVRNELQISGE